MYHHHRNVEFAIYSDDSQVCSPDKRAIHNINSTTGNSRGGQTFSNIKKKQKDKIYKKKKKNMDNCFIIMEV